MSLLRPKSGMFRYFRGIKTIVDQVDKAKYQEMLPKVFEPHDNPYIILFIADYIKVFPWPLTRYQEGAVLLACKYKGEDYLHVFTMPVTSLVSRWGGRRMGYPKYVADEIYLRQEGDQWEGRVTHKGRCKLSLSFTAGMNRDPREAEKVLVNNESFFTGRSINLCPPKIGPAITTVRLEHMVEANWSPSYGMIKVDVDEGEEIDGLFDKEEAYIGMFNEFRGGINLIPQRLN